MDSLLFTPVTLGPLTLRNRSFTAIAGLSPFGGCRWSGDDYGGVCSCDA